MPALSNTRSFGRGISRDHGTLAVNRKHNLESRSLAHHRFHLDAAAMPLHDVLADRQNIVERHGGRIEVKSVVGQGTTFKIVLPVDSQSPVVAADPSAETASVG